MNIDMDSLFGSLDDVVPAAAAPPVTQCSRCGEDGGWVLELGAVVCSFCGQRQDTPCSEIERARYHRIIAETRARLDASLTAQERRWLVAERGRAHQKGA